MAKLIRAMAGKASAEFRSRYSIPLRRTAGSFIILEQLRDGKMVKSIHPKIGGRLRLAHEQNQQISITAEIIRYDENVAVVKCVTTTMKGSFPGIGMASVERDHSIAPAILELAETRAIARSLRSARSGVSPFHLFSYFQQPLKMQVLMKDIDKKPFSP